MSLREIQESVQKIAQAVAAVLRVEVEIADSDFLRIAGTGKTESGVLRTMAGEDHIYRASLVNGEPVVITRPGQDEKCRPCTHYGSCAETGEICCPIRLDGQSVGVIGLLAFDDEQRERLFADVEAILGFLQKMAELIAVKLKEHIMYTRQQLIAEKLRVVMDEMDKAMLLIDQKNCIVEANQRARQYLQLDADDSQAAEWIAAIRLADGSQPTPKQVVLSVGGKAKTFLFAIRPVQLGDEIKEWVITLDDAQEVVEMARRVTATDAGDAFAAISGNSAALLQAKTIARTVAGSESTILLQGESGTGKELFAKAIHQASPRRQQPLISINCAAIPEHLMESELFGYEDGTFTGARKGGKAGVFEAAGKGTLFLDEIGDLPMHLQGKLLRVLQEKEFQRLGSSGKTLPVEARIIAATHLDLQERVAQGQFRLDLYYRLHVIPIQLPALRERREDILLLAHEFLAAYTKTLGKTIRGFSQEAQSVLFCHDWPGNVRELANTVEYAANLENSDWIQAASLPGHTFRLQKPAERTGRTDSSEAPKPVLTLKELEKSAVAQALNEVRMRKGKKEEAAALLGISRATLFRKMREYGLL
ncbi:sigma 54-interacting transcriptional regulator [Brevibacillus parabrevis]|uniref:sigma-54-dependent Fis family transcriptional regulator n=1 Tax=Brevibacillus parabrevis TaxID=54914 RepID=UPI0028D1ADED|nr:sigma 54-interacting transcriptional regulator [Brevibacillus parabrevis]